MRTVFFLTILLFLARHPVSPVQAHTLITGDDALQTARAVRPVLASAGETDKVRAGTQAEKDLVVTSDSRDYCSNLDATLSNLLSQPHNVPASVMEDARSLQMQGVALCDHAHIRAGIERLRRALVLLKKYGEQKS